MRNSFIVALQATIATVRQRVSVEGEFELRARTSGRSHGRAGARNRSCGLAVCDRRAWIVKVLEFGMAFCFLSESGDRSSLVEDIVSMGNQINVGG